MGRCTAVEILELEDHVPSNCGPETMLRADQRLPLLEEVWRALTDAERRTISDRLAKKPATDSDSSIDLKARHGLIEGHIISESTGVLYRSASCSCGWTTKIDRLGNAWAQTAKLRVRERSHLRSAASTKN